MSGPAARHLGGGEVDGIQEKRCHAVSVNVGADDPLVVPAVLMMLARLCTKSHRAQVFLLQSLGFSLC